MIAENEPFCVPIGWRWGEASVILDFIDSYSLFAGALPILGSGIHFIFYDTPKQICASLRYQRDKICSRLGVIVFLKPDGTPIMYMRIEFYFQFIVFQAN
jgi:hypothetical protein